MLIGGYKMTMNEKLYKLSQYKITLIRWKDEWKHWRLGLDWNSEDDFFFVVEKPTINECLNEALNYINNKMKWKKEN